MQPGDLRRAILGENVRAVQAIKGIGAKTAQRVVLELKDKIRKESYTTAATGGGNIPVTRNNSVRQEALSALVTLGIARNVAEKSIDTIVKKEGNEITVEQLIRLALR